MNMRLPKALVQAILLIVSVGIAGPTCSQGEAAAAKLPAASGGAATAVGIVPTAKITQVLLAGKDGVPEDFSQPVSMQAAGDYLHTEQDNGAIHYFRRDAKAGTVSYAGVVAATRKDHYAGLYAAGGRLYAVRANGSMAFVDGCLLCLTYGGDLALVEPHPEGFKKLAEMKAVITRDLFQHRRAAKLNDPQAHVQEYFAPCWAAPTVARGKLYLHYSDRLICYDLMK